jgi:hypothetical protein
VLARRYWSSPGTASGSWASAEKYSREPSAHAADRAPTATYDGSFPRQNARQSLGGMLRSPWISGGQYWIMLSVIGNTAITRLAIMNITFECYQIIVIPYAR